MAKQRYKAEEVITALRASGGVMAEAARKLECHRGTVENYIKRYPTVAAAHKEARATLVDTAESKLKAMVDHGEWPAVRFVLVTLGKDRGFTERTETVSLAPADDGLADLQAAINKVYGKHDSEASRRPQGERADEHDD